MDLDKTFRELGIERVNAAKLHGEWVVKVADTFDWPHFITGTGSTFREALSSAIEALQKGK
jgi:hypothetical protein